MDGLTDPSDADREFDELRRRAYGRDADIAVDPTALARLHELEASHRANGRRRANGPTIDSGAGADFEPAMASTDTVSPNESTPEATKSPDAAPPMHQGPLWSLVERATAMSQPLVHRAMATRRSRLAWSAGTLIVAVGIVADLIERQWVLDVRPVDVRE